MEIDVGAAAISRGTITFFGDTYVNKDNPANAGGKITQVQIYVTTALENCKIGIFEEVSENTLTARSSTTLGAVAEGYSEHAVDLDIVEGDLIGIFFTAGRIAIDNTGGAGRLYKTGDQMECVEEAFSLSADKVISLYGLGSTPVVGRSQAIIIG